MTSDDSNLDRLLRARSEIDSELRQHKTSTSILFTDLVGSTAYFERYGDTAGLAMVSRHTNLAATVVRESSGRIIKTIGDAVMAAFEDCRAGVAAAVEIQRRLLRLNQTLPERERLQLRIGMHYGIVFRQGEDLYGDVVNVAARITHQCGPAQILVSGSVREGLAGLQEFRLLPAGRASLKGKTDQVELFEVAWTDTRTYTELRQHLTQAIDRGELVASAEQLKRLLETTRENPLRAAPALPAAAPMATAPGALHSRYQVVREIGSGGMGIVYKAQDRETGELVALKVIRPDIAADQAVMERFKNELRLARKITHRNVCRIYELSRIENTIFISMEFVEGASLREILNSIGSLSLRRGVQVGRQICAALGEAHAQGIIHRDLKPENIMLDQRGEVKLMDFGIARALDRLAATTNMVVGTPAYMSPEQAEGKPLDHRSDIYSAGLVLYEVFTGSPVFQGDTPIAVALKHVREQPTPPREIEPNLPTGIERIVLRCLEKDPAERFQSVGELDTWLARFADDKPTPRRAPAPRRAAAAAGGAAAGGVGIATPPGVTPPPLVETPKPARAQRRARTPAPVAPTPARVPVLLPEPPARGRRWGIWIAAGTILGAIAVIAYLRGPALVARLSLSNRPAEQTSAPPKPESAELSPDAAAARVRLGAWLVSAHLDKVVQAQYESQGVTLTGTIGPDVHDRLLKEARPLVAPLPLIDQTVEASMVVTPDGATPPATSAGVKSPSASAIPPGTKANPAAGGGLHLTSDPKGARVEMTRPDDKKEHDCTTPCTLAGLPAGEYTMVLTLPGYRDSLRVLDLGKGEQKNYDVALEPLGGTATIEVTPADATILADGKPVQVSFDHSFFLAPGKHVIRVERDGYVAQEFLVTVKDEDVFIHQVKLAPQR